MEPRQDQTPLLLSGLVLAGANRAGRDGTMDREDDILTAEELAMLDLCGVELAVLSACDTGQGRVEVGEGVFGLRRALEIAGVRTVVMTAWPVPDRQARRWMHRFCGSWLDGASILESRRDATLDLLEDLRARDYPIHPYFWAGFQAAGGWR